MRDEVRHRRFRNLVAVALHKAGGTDGIYAVERLRPCRSPGIHYREAFSRSAPSSGKTTDGPC